MQTGKQVTSGLVLRETHTKESDKILTILTPDLGKISVIARGARKKNSRLAASSQLLAFSELTIYRRGNWCYLDEGSTIELFEGVRRDFERLSLASYFAELAESICGEETPVPEVLSLLLNALYALSYLEKDPLLVKLAFELRLMAISGFEPSAGECAVCGRSEIEQPMLDVVQGCVHCRKCKTGGGLSLPLTDGGLQALQHILRCPAKKLYSFSLQRQSLHCLAQASEGFVAAQLERSFRTLDYYKSIRTTMK